MSNQRAISRWTYEEPYEFYNMDDSVETITELLNGEYFSVLDEKQKIIGFFCFGSSAQVPKDEYKYSADYTDIGIGMKPDLCGIGLGASFFQTSLQYLKDHFGKKQFRLTVADFNKRAIRLYEKAGFVKQVSFIKHSDDRNILFQTMTIDV
ncbi:GNAT family N-acetyltransferase [Bacillaceae bacterium Marseille-Q3522]|nr:GNAT family N-acetyltransferase [Bacillaceae bacterium Marseille-Q3522]